MKNEIKYEVQFLDDCIDEWNTLDVFESKKEAKCARRDYRRFDKMESITVKYRIIKLTIIKEVVN